MYLCTYSVGIAITPDLSSEFELETLCWDKVKHCVWHDSFTCVWHDSSVCDMTHLCVTWLIHTELGLNNEVWLTDNIVLLDQYHFDQSHCVVVLLVNTNTGWRRLIGSLIFIGHFRKSDVYLVALLSKMICNLGDPMSLRHPVLPTTYGLALTLACATDTRRVCSTSIANKMVVQWYMVDQ